MTTGATTQWMDQRLDALDRALLGLLPRQERIDLVASIESKMRPSGESKPLANEETPSLHEEISILAAADRTPSRSLRKRSRMALSSGILGIVALGLLLLFPLTYVIVATVAELIGEVPAIALIVLNILAVAGAGTVSGLLALMAIVRLSKSSSKKRGLGWAITGLCTSPAPMLCGLLAMVFFVLPMTMQYASEANTSTANYVASTPVPSECAPGTQLLPPDGATLIASLPPDGPAPAGNVMPVASLAPAYRPAPAAGNSSSPMLETPNTSPEMKAPSRFNSKEANQVEASKSPAAVEPASAPSAESIPLGGYGTETPPSFQETDLMLS